MTRPAHVHAASKLVTLPAWAASLYGDAAPGLATLRRWAREARIRPAPVKHGRTYFVAPDAVYLDSRSYKHGPQRPLTEETQLAGSPVRT